MCAYKVECNSYEHAMTLNEYQNLVNFILPLFQALVRGVLVRKQLKELQDVYREILSELQGDSDTDVFWKDNFCKPQVSITLEYIP